jgi:hypothetical protein
MTDPQLPPLSSVFESRSNRSLELQCFSDSSTWFQAAQIAAPYDAELARLSAAIEEREEDMHARIRAGYDKTIADSWRAKAAEQNAELARLREREKLLIKFEELAKEVHAALIDSTKIYSDLDFLMRLSALAPKDGSDG